MVWSTSSFWSSSACPSPSSSAVEAAFLYPWAVIVREVGVVGLVEVGIFLLVLIAGLVYAWKKGALEWL
jgi:NADH:ubiquinone oxidoreductase subunit 3 (subunit A)